MIVIFLRSRTWTKKIPSVATGIKPKVVGPASEFLETPCIAEPATDNANPETNPTRRGNKFVSITLNGSLKILVVLLKGYLNNKPIKIEKNISTAAIIIANLYFRVVLALLILFINFVCSILYIRFFIVIFTIISIC